MKMIKSSYLSFFLLFLIAIMISTISASLAWLSIEGSKDVTLTPGTFKIDTLVSEKIEDEKVEITPYDGVFTINGLSFENNENAKNKLGIENYPTYSDPLISNLNIDITLDAEIAGYMRVKLKDEWIVTRKYVNFDRVTTEIIFKDEESAQLYKLAENWVYDEKTNYFYYTNIIEKGESINIPFISSGTSYNPKTSSYYVETCMVNITLSIQVVQANRYEAIWGISSIPQPGMEVSE